MLAAAALAVALPATQGDARPKPPPPPPVEIYVPPPPPPFLGVGLNDRMVADAAAYQAYMQRATSLSPAFHDGPTVASSLRTGAAYEPAALVRGSVAFAAIAALQEPTFVAGLRTAGRDPEARRLMLNRMIAEPAYVFTFPGADAAARNAKLAIGGAGLRLLAVGKAVKQSAYDVQHEAWSKDFVVDPSGRLAAVKGLSSVAPQPAPDMASSLRTGIAGGAPLGLGQSPVVRYQTPLIAKAMILAAFAAVGEAGDAAYQRLTYLTTEQNAAYCLSMAKLNLNQCLAVAKPHYEDIFCLGQHVLMDTGQCLAMNGGGLMPIEIRTPPLKLTPLRGAARRPVKHHR
ncbi:MAG TPA: hypothetical protein VF459_14880 [Caulobacteraceae bacterium]